MEPKKFSGKSALVTAAGSGIGRAVALRLAREGADVAVSDISREGVAETADMIAGEGGKASPFVCDAGNEQEISRFVADGLDVLGHIDILAGCAGIGDSQYSFDDLDSALWDKIFAVNVKGPFLLSRLVARHLIERGAPGRIVHVASTEGKTNRAGTIAYSSSKHALVGLVQGLAFQLAPYDITVNAVCPGLIDTPAWHKSDEKMGMEKGSTLKMVVDSSIESLQLKIPRAGTADEIAAAVSFLASDEAVYMTGQAINVCGGLEYH